MRRRRVHKKPYLLLAAALLFSGAVAALIVVRLSSTPEPNAEPLANTSERPLSVARGSNHAPVDLRDKKPNAAVSNHTEIEVGKSAESAVTFTEQPLETNLYDSDSEHSAARQWLFLVLLCAALGGFALYRYKRRRRRHHRHRHRHRTRVVLTEDAARQHSEPRA
jgi:hypothetical protein